jgi:hypothetical protein
MDANLEGERSLEMGKNFRTEKYKNQAPNLRLLTLKTFFPLPAHFLIPV